MWISLSVKNVQCNYLSKLKLVWGSVYSPYTHSAAVTSNSYRLFCAHTRLHWLTTLGDYNKVAERHNRVSSHPVCGSAFSKGLILLKSTLDLSQFPSQPQSSCCLPELKLRLKFLWYTWLFWETKPRSVGRLSAEIDSTVCCLGAGWYTLWPIERAICLHAAIADFGSQTLARGGLVSELTLVLPESFLLSREYLLLISDVLLVQATSYFTAICFI